MAAHAPGARKTRSCTPIAARSQARTPSRAIRGASSSASSIRSPRMRKSAWRGGWVYRLAESGLAANEKIISSPVSRSR
ncbi:hypothetical protein [Microbispora triticiradicis]|uniref:hypothetical protein n=1 Tax=Microbispora TaxID=2005 RepID=UPI001FCAA6F5|nr:MULTISPECIES: hypothetical protein [Microbispora]